MKNFQILILILGIGLNSCSEKKEKVELTEIDTNMIDDSYKYDRFWITYNYPNNISEKVEVYVSQENDTINNQSKFLKDGVIDSTKSRFYEVILKKSKKPDTYDGIFYFYSEHSSNTRNVDEEKTLRLSIFQKSRDSSYFQSFESKASRNVEFELVNYENDELVGIMWEMRFIQKDIEGKDMLEVIETHLAVDNKLKTDNVGIEIYNLEKR